MCRELGVSEATYHRWRNQFGGLKAEDAKRLKDLERENCHAQEAVGRCRAGEGRAQGDRTGKLLSPERRRAAVHHLQRVLGVSERFACRVTGQHRATQRHQPASTTPADPDAALRAWLRDYAKDHPRRGFRPAYHDARGEGWTVNHKKIQRLWREEGLRVPQRRRRKRVGTSTAPDTPTACARTGCGRWTSSSTPPATDDRSRSCRSSTNTPASASAASSPARSPPTPHRRTRPHRRGARLPESAAQRQRTRTGLCRDDRLGRPAVSAWTSSRPASPGETATSNRSTPGCATNASTSTSSGR